MVNTAVQNKKVPEKRIKWCLKGKKDGPVIILFVGVHGNEKAGVKAADQLCRYIEKNNLPLNGSIYVITGNKPALDLGVRFIDTDLNRIWEKFHADDRFTEDDRDSISEFRESVEIKESIRSILNTHESDASDIIFADLHTTSSKSCAFILLNDTLGNRYLAKQFPAPQILGIEENIHGTLLSYIDNLGYKAIVFEAGAHKDFVSFERSEAFLWLLLHNTDVFSLDEKKVLFYIKKIRAHEDVPETYYEIIYHKLLADPQSFKMLDGFQNFDKIKKNTPLAYENGKLIRAEVSGRIFMPLYQNKGHDGFMIISQVSDFWLELSAQIRGSSLNRLLKYLPGVTVVNKRSFEVDLDIARFLVKDFFHLLGYRVIHKSENRLLCYRR